VNDIAQFELNEAFSVVVRIAEKVCNIDPAKINVNGYVLSHPLIPLIYSILAALLRSVMLSATPGRALSFLSCTLSSPGNMAPLVSVMG